MELGKEQWYVRWFFWSLEIWDEFREENTAYQYRERTNLCHFMRVIFVWCPLVLLLHVLLYGSALVALTYLPVHLFGVSGYASCIGAIMTIIAALWLVGATRQGLSNLSEALHEGFEEKRREDAEEAARAPAPQGPGFFEVLWQYLVGVKKKICPTISFTRKEVTE